MISRQSANWHLRIGFFFSAIIGIAWGVLLGWFEVGVNAWLLPWLILLVGMPIAFFGSMIVGMVFHRMLLSWHKLARLLVALLMVAVGVPFGLLWGVLANGYNAVQLVNESGVSTWILEWILVILGLFGGMWPRWTVPFLKLFGRFAAWLSQGPVAILRWIGERTIAIFESIARFFEAIGHMFVDMPVKLYRSVVTRFQDLGTVHHPPELTTQETPASPPRTRRPIFRRARLSKPKRSSTVARKNGHNGDALRVTGVIEDRCPYCLDIVKRNDPRGVKVCEVCGTPHHADCWSITGKCQVPHLNK
jgi:hypothetical protein